jgi:hypothetical protein
MDHEFNNRISAQRKVLQVINQKPWLTEPLFGLSSKAIDRWIAVNRIDLNSAIVKMIKDVSAKLFFLANKSQDQVSEQYRLVRAEIISACDDIQDELQKLRSGRNRDGQIATR